MQEPLLDCSPISSEHNHSAALMSNNIKKVGFYNVIVLIFDKQTNKPSVRKISKKSHINVNFFVKVNFQGFLMVLNYFVNMSQKVVEGNHSN